jgi:hypothetical protein
MQPELNDGLAIRYRHQHCLFTRGATLFIQNKKSVNSQKRALSMFAITMETKLCAEENNYHSIKMTGFVLTDLVGFEPLPEWRHRPHQHLLFVLFPSKQLNVFGR